jgi:energy-converting hydrogenase A subunit G
MLVPEFVPAIFCSWYLPAIYTGFIVAFIGLIGIAINKSDMHVLILTDIAGLAMLIIVGAVGTDLAEALVLPGLVVELAEILAISEILLSREMRKKGKTSSLLPMPTSLDMEIIRTAPNFISLVLIGYGIFLTGFTGGAVAGAGILLYVLSKKAQGLPVLVIEGIGAISGIAWCLWIVGFLLFFVKPDLWLLSLFLAACGLLLKVASKMGLIATLMKEEFKRQ